MIALTISLTSLNFIPYQTIKWNKRSLVFKRKYLQSYALALFNLGCLDLKKLYRN